MNAAMFQLSKSEIRQFASMMVSMCAGEYRINKRKVSKKVRRIAESRGLIDEKGEYQTRLFTWRDLPIESLWIIVEPMIGDRGSVGRSIASNPKWLDLNIWPEGHRHHTDNDLGEIMDCLHSLFGFVWFQHAGSVWEVTKR